ncbi:MAG: hypothetical protein AABX34_07440 [Nanoarchaeota archaeon]
MPEMRFTVTKKLNELILESAEDMGVFTVLVHFYYIFSPFIEESKCQK